MNKKRNIVPIRIAVLVSGGGTNLQALIDAQKSKKLRSGRIELVISSNPGAYALTRANINDIDIAVVNRKELKQAEFEQRIRELLTEHRIDLIILAGFMCILSPAFTAAYPCRILNVHPSLIPSFCGKGYYGLHVHEEVLRYGVKVTGATVHFVNEIPDGGRIILQKAVAVHKNDTPESLQKRVMKQAEWMILPRAAEIVSSLLADGETDLENKI